MMLQPVVTGIGVVSGFGLGMEALLGGLRAGQAPLAPLPFPASGFPHEEGACGPPRRELARALTRRKDLKLMSRDTLMALAAGVAAWEDAGLPSSSVDPEEVGVFLAVGREKGEVTALGPAVAAAAAECGSRLDIERLARLGLDLINPLDSLKTLPNMALAHLAIRLGLRGPSMALCGGPDAGRQALTEARAAVAEARCMLAMAGGTESLVSFAGYVQAWREGLLSQEDLPGEAAAVLVFEDRSHALQRGIRPYAGTAEAPDPARVAALTGVCGVAAWPLASLVLLAQAGREARS